MDTNTLITNRFGLDAAPAPADAINPTLARFLARRTHRRYRADPVPDTLIDLLLAVALSASSKSDFQQASIIKVKDSAKRARIAAHFPAMPWIGTSPVLLV